ncbi:MAG: hypothetical protein PHP52_00190 [Bacteroidales bacterium]|nr:hypothetical protein [Bacteroidales bacterium]MDD4215999.1 hypothetical protein [Bacteroidales bacterium]MDY0140838.1 hypothetical protein [Bacteroidales bacterium]
MGVGGFFKLPEYNVYDYKPRFYDPDKEERKERRRELRDMRGKTQSEIEDDTYKPGSTIKGSFRPKMPRRAYRSRSSTIRLFVIMAVLFFLAYILIVVDLTPLIKFFSR